MRFGVMLQHFREHASPEAIRDMAQAAEALGYDIRSEGQDGSVRYIEVKGHTTTGDVTLYYTEWQTANRMREEFFIYDVRHALTAPQLWIVQDPVGKGIRPAERVVEYRIPAADLQAAAVPAGPLPPAVTNH